MTTKSPAARIRLRVLTVVAFVASMPSPAGAICNLIPPAEKLFPSVKGSVSAPIAAPGSTVRIKLDGCNPTPGFHAVAAQNVVTLRFEPPTGPPTSVLVPGGNVSLPTTSCASGPCLELDVAIPPTTGMAGSYGLTGPARISVERTDMIAQTIAEIADLYEPTKACARVPEAYFRQFTVLPPPNDFAAIADAVDQSLYAEIQATVDGSGSLLIPFDYLAVLPGGIGAPIARLLKGGADLDAFAATPGHQALMVPCSALVRSFTLDGRPLPPLLRIDATGQGLIGTADGDLGIIRIARTGDCGAGSVGPLFDFGDRMALGKGPVVIDTSASGLDAVSGPTVVLRSLRSSQSTAGFTRDEALEGLDLNGDGDLTDHIVEIIDLETGTTTLVAVPSIEVRHDGQTVPTVETSGDLVAFLESEALQTTSASTAAGDLNGDGDAFDSVLRVLEIAPDGSAVDRTAVLSGASRTADGAPSVNRRPLVVSNGLVFFRTLESSAIPTITQRASLGAGGVDTDGPSGLGSYLPNSVSTGGDRVLFWSEATNIQGLAGPHHYVATYVDGVLSDVSAVDVDSSEAPCSPSTVPGLNHASISDGGDFVAFVGRCPTPLLPGEMGLPTYDNVYLRDLASGTTTRVSVGLGGAAPNSLSYFAEVSGDGRFVVFGSQASNLVSGDVNGFDDVFLYETATAQVFLVSKDSDGNQANGHSSLADVSDEGRFIAFSSSATNLGIVPAGSFSSVYLHDRSAQTTTPISRCRNGGAPNAGSGAAKLSGDGRFVYFGSAASNLLSADCSTAGDTNGSGDTFVYDRLRARMERVSVSSAGGESGQASVVGTQSADGRFVAFYSEAPNLASGDTNTEDDAFLHDRLTGATQRVSLASSGAEAAAGCAPGPCVNGVAVSPEGTAVAFSARFSDLVAGDANGVHDVFLRRPDPGAAASFDIDGNGKMVDPVLQVFDPETQSMRSNAWTRAAEASVADGRALILVPNGKAVFLYDGNTDERIDLGVEANRVALSEELAAVTLGGTSRDTLAVWPIPLPVPLPGSPPDTGIAAAGITVVRDVVLLETSEAAVNAIAPIAADLNGDGDTGDRVLRIYRHESAAPQPSNVGFQVEELEADPDPDPAKGHLVAFRVSEALQGNVDLNDDGDTADFVMHVYDLANDALIPTGQSAMTCTIPGCEPGIAYKVRGDTVSFLTRECDQGGAQTSPGCPGGGTDLNGDGDADDIVVQVFNAATGSGQVFDATDEADGKAPPPLPEKLYDEPILYSTVRETDEDLNKDGDLDDTVTLIVGDQDQDGVFDDSKASGGDVCPVEGDTKQLDSDRDGIGDVCEGATAYCGTHIPANPPVPPVSAERCQQKIGSLGSSYLKKRLAAQRACYKRIAQGSLSGDAAALCVGRFVGDLEVLPTDAKTASSVHKATASFSKALARSCTDANIGALDTCAATPSVTAVDQCVRAAHGRAANEATALAYGPLTSIADPDARTCQIALGDASVGYVQEVLRAVTMCLKSVGAGCLGSSAEGGGVAPPSDPATAARLLVANQKLLSRLDRSCPDDPPGGTTNAVLDALDVCSEIGPRTEASVASCLACTQWRRATEMIRAGYGPGES